MSRDLGKPIYKKFRRYKFLEEILGRLQDEAGTTLRHFDNLNKKAVKNKNRTVGYWTGPRILFPVIEATSKAYGKSKWDFLSQNLDIEPASLTWQMFRNSLIHGDKLLYARYKRKKVKWGVIMDRGHHNIGKRKLYIDLLTLYDSLESFLKTEVKKKDTSYISVQIGIDYTNETNNKAKSIIQDIKNL